MSARANSSDKRSKPTAAPPMRSASRRAADTTRAKEMLGFEYSIEVGPGMTDLIRYEAAQGEKA